MLQQGERRCKVVRGAVDTTEEESIDRELRRASDGLYLNKAAVIGVGALPVIGAAAVAVKRATEKELASLADAVAAREDTLSKQLASKEAEREATAKAYIRCLNRQRLLEGNLFQSQLDNLVVSQELEARGCEDEEADERLAFSKIFEAFVLDVREKEAALAENAKQRERYKEETRKRKLRKLRNAAQKEKDKEEAKKQQKKLTKLGKAKKHTEVELAAQKEELARARNELKEAEAKSTAQLTALTQQRHMVIDMLAKGDITKRAACLHMDTLIWKNKDIFTAHNWHYYADMLDIVIQPHQSVLLSILDPLLRTRQQDAGQAAGGEIRVSISISTFETCLRDWSQTNPPPEDIQQIRSTPPHHRPMDNSYLEIIDKEWVEMVTRVFPENFVPTHGGKPHRRTPSWWEGCSTNTL